MSSCLGIDTSNYTTSAAILDNRSDEFTQNRRLLPVKGRGLRQSDALFAHVKALPEILDKLLHEKSVNLSAVGVSSRPRDLEGSYMPCFEAGVSVAHSIAVILGIPFFEFSHQAGHIASALFSIGRLDVLQKPFIAFHVSGGTTEAVLCSPGKGASPVTKLLHGSLDLKAGQAIDRVGIMLGLRFPAGPELEKLALQSDAQYRINPCVKNGDCCLSGLENQCADMKKDGVPAYDIARFCIESVKATLEKMTQTVMEEYPGIPLLYAGGVMSDSIIRNYFVQKYGALFAKPAFSSDNAVGIAALTKISLANSKSGAF